MASHTLIAPVAIWQYLEQRPHSWRRQLSVKGRRLLASSVWSDLLANGLTEEEIAESRDLPLEAVRECVRYCKGNRSLLEAESKEEAQWLAVRGASLAPPPAH